MTIERFTKNEFEQVLTDAGYDWSELGLLYNEYVYRIQVTENSAIELRSSIDASHKAADVGQDSIRMWPQIRVPHGIGSKWQAGKKPDAYTTRVIGWEQRMTEKINTLVVKCQRVKNDVGYCPTCNKVLWAGFSNSAKNPNRPYASCRKDNYFTWLDQEPVMKVMTDTQKKEIDKSGSPIDFLDKSSEVVIVDSVPQVTQKVSAQIAVAKDTKVYEPNAEQAKAIFAPLDKALRVLAPPGSGKTWLLEQRIKYLVEQDVDPKNILYVTFSKDMADSGLARILATNPDLISTEIVKQICTIHALCYRIYKEENVGQVNVAKDWQVKKEINLISEGDERKGRKGLWEDNNKRPGWQEILAWINLAKASGLEGNEIQKFYHLHLGSYHGERMTKMFEKLQVIFKRMHTLTFSDMLYEVELMFRNQPSVLAKYQQRFQHVIVDEAQDTSAQAMRILTALAEPQNQFCVVGDTDQMLYRFAGATPEDNLYDGFESRYPDATTVKLVINYRSTKAIIDACNRLIRHNYSDMGGPYEQRYLKDVEARPDAPQGDAVTFSSYINPEDEADNIVREIKIKLDSGANVLGDFFVGTRTRAQLGYMEGYFIRNNVPFINIAGGSFWNLKHVRDIVAYLSVAHNDEDKESFKRIYNISSNNMTVPWSNSEQFGQYCSHRFLGKAFLDACYGSYKYINTGRNSRKSFSPGINDIVDFIQEIQTEILAGGASDALQFIIDYCYKKWLAAEEGLVNTDEAENGKLEDLQTVVDMAQEYGNVGDFLKFVEDARQADEAKKDKDWSDYVVISTIHRLKGLEREIVFGAGMSEGEIEDTGMPAGLLPHTFSLTPPPQNGILPTGGQSLVEDERDIAFVLVSRAKSECHLSGVQTYRKATMLPSRFVSEMGLLR